MFRRICFCLICLCHAVSLLVLPFHHDYNSNNVAQAIMIDGNVTGSRGYNEKLVPASCCSCGLKADSYNNATMTSSVDLPDKQQRSSASSSSSVYRRVFHHHSLQRRSIRKSSVVGSSAILDCDIPYPPRDGGEASGEGSSSYGSSAENSKQTETGSDLVEQGSAAAASTSTASEFMIKWHKQGIEVPIFIQLDRLPAHVDAAYNGRVRLLDGAGASIEITNVRTSDEGWYECSVVFIRSADDTNPNGTWVYLAVTAPPTLGNVSPGFLVVREGQSAEMSCEATGIPQPTLTWLKDGDEIVTSSRVSVVRNRLIIKHLVRVDAGLYTCLFKNDVAQTSHPIRVVVEGENWVASSNAYILVPPKNMTASEGSRVRFSCQAGAHPDNVTHRWFRNGVDIGLVAGLVSRSGVDPDGSLVIGGVVRDDTGWYRCQPTNGVGQPPEAEAYLNVTYLPRVLSQPGQLYLARSMPARLDCPADANPPVTSVVWTKNGRLLQLDVGGGVDASEPAAAREGPRVSLTRRGTLVFRAVVADDAGRYSCTPNSVLGAGQPSVPVQVLVKDPPHFVLRPKPLYQRHPGQSVSMPCVAEGDPKPTIIWRKGEGVFPASRAMHHGDGNLTILHLSQDDRGMYECVASNAVSDVITTSLLVMEMTTPHAPYNVTVSTTQFTAKVSWLPAYDGGHPQHYVLWYKPRDMREDWSTFGVVPGAEPAMSVTVYGLMPNTVYKFMVLSRNRLGDGLFSKVVDAATRGDGDTEETDEEEADPDESSADYAEGDDEDGDVEETERPNGDESTETGGQKPDPPFNVSVQLQRDGGLNIAWLPPRHTPEPVDRYQIEYRTVGQWVPLGAEIPADKVFHTWKTPSRGAIYHFRVISISSSSQRSESSPVFTIHTTDPRQVTSSIRLPDMTIALIAGGLLFAFLIIVVGAVCVRLRRRRKQRDIRYDSVKYFGSNQNDSNQIIDRIPEVPVCSVVPECEPIPLMDNHVTVLTHTNHDRKVIQETPI